MKSKMIISVSYRLRESRRRTIGCAKKKMDDFKLFNKYLDSFLVRIVSLSEHFDIWSSLLCSLTANFVRDFNNFLFERHW